MKRIALDTDAVNRIVDTDGALDQIKAAAAGEGAPMPGVGAGGVKRETNREGTK
jgi:hypothetical protein